MIKILLLSDIQCSNNPQKLRIPLMICASTSPSNRPFHRIYTTRPSVTMPSLTPHANTFHFSLTLPQISSSFLNLTQQKLNRLIQRLPRILKVRGLNIQRARANLITRLSPTIIVSTILTHTPLSPGPYSHYKTP